MSTQPLYFEPEAFEKLAGYKLPANPKLWQSEIIRYLKSQHPYLPLETAEIDLRRLDASKGAAVGSVILEGEMAVPVVIARPRPGSDPELAPMDVFFHKGRYRYLDPETVRSVTQSPAVGEPEGGASRAMGGNPYVGDVTGDATPLEYSGQASPFAGPYDGAKTAGVKSRVIEQLRKMPDTGKSAIVGAAFRVPSRVSMAVEQENKARAADPKRKRIQGVKRLGKAVAVGAVEGGAMGALVGKTKDVLYKKSDYDVANGFTARLLKTGAFDPNDLANVRQMLATNPALLKGLGGNLAVIDMVTRVQPETRTTTAVRKPNIVQIFEAPSGINIKFSGGPAQRVSQDELKSILGDRYAEVMRKLRSGVVYVESDGVERASWDPEGRGSEALPVTSDGGHMIYTRRGDTIAGYVCRQLVTIDGQVVPKKLFVSADGRYGLATDLFGSRLTTSPRLPSRPPKTGQHGVFVSYIHGTPIPTTPMTISGVRLVTDSGGRTHTLYLIHDSVTGKKVTLVPVAGVQDFQQMMTVNDEISALADGVVYYAPGDIEWVPLTSKVDVAESSDQLTKLSSERSSTHVTSDGALWHVKAAFVGGFLRTGASQIGKLVTNPSAIGRGAKNIYNAAGGGLKGVGGVAKAYAPGAAMIAAPLAAGAVGASMLGGRDKNASWQDLSEWDARELLTAMGMDGDGVAWALGEAKRRPGLDRGVKIAGLHEPQVHGFEVIELPTPEYDQATVRFAAACRPSTALFKAAAASSVPETLDAVLSLEFITPQNLKYFVDSIDDFDETASRVAAMLVAVRLGMPHVPEEPVRQALEGLSKTVNRLRVLKSALDHRAEQASTTEP